MAHDKRQRRALIQCLTWAQGKPYHEPVNDECVPDFSCCYPEMFTDDENERWRIYRLECLQIISEENKRNESQS